MEENRTYIAIDLKSFYASVECVQRGLDPLTTNLVVADASRTEKTICLAVTPSLKAHGISGRARLFEVIQRVEEVNRLRLCAAPQHSFEGRSFIAPELEKNPSLELDYITAKPQMAKYMSISAQIYQIYLRYIAPEDIHVYSVDEVFIDATAYLRTYHMTAHRLAREIISHVLAETGITATAGIGTNLYLCKIAMDIMAKKMPADADGVRIAELEEMSFRRQLWGHAPLTDFWRVGAGTARRLAQLGIYTMGDLARFSLTGEDVLYREFGVNAELLIDHAWGWEPCLISDIKEYRPQSSSLSLGQVLPCPYTNEKGRLILREMTDLLCLDLVEKGLDTDKMTLVIGYDVQGVSQDYCGKLVLDHFGRTLPKPAHGSVNLGRRTSSVRLITQAVTELYDRITDPGLMVRRVNIVAENTAHEGAEEAPEQLDLFADPTEHERENIALAREHSMQQAVIALKNKFGKNAVLRGMNLEEGATTIERNGQVGGHHA